MFTPNGFVLKKGTCFGWPHVYIVGLHLVNNSCYMDQLLKHLVAL